MKPKFGKTILEKRFGDLNQTKKKIVKDSITEYSGADKLDEILTITDKKIYNAKIVVEEEDQDKALAKKYLDSLRMDLSIPPRVPHKDLTKEQYKKIEAIVFNEWKRINNSKIFERNLEIWRQFWLTCEKADVIVQIVDSRNPQFFVNEDISTMYPTKKHILLSNKSDLTTRRVDTEGYDVYYYSATSENTVLNFLLDLDCSTIGFIGYPNVGKSSTINAIVNDKRVRVSKTPGKTKHIQTIKLSDTKTLIDCPGLVFPKHNKTDLLLHGVLNVDTILDLKSSLYQIIKFIGIYKLNKFYSLPMFENDSRYPVEINFLNNMADHKQWSTTTCLKNIVKDLCSGDIQYERIEEELNLKNSFKWME
ncbi:Large subunit GTPase 1 [Nosema granulosis]|uniref:Large subunit GTPase 1 n=1 Tax=Nosema granulosis TaxID=83296 RepID=A0A9P6H2Q1_9MICR|nr:Large subunit GTPase 1 [Nosema granulosis]